ncbi:HpcH/HpaI aldolase/citrate lyase family protein [Nocardia sp. NPDC101769]|uniref:HpcH/HpaI aldolase/citrate lyase family protein n=1 Tax=Nocardia sp. NPDC101769 TaxID=3364333 RepID=UPI003816232E
MTYPGTWLYAPGDRPDRMAKALATGAETVVFDLQDAVADAHKHDARRAVVEFMGDLDPDDRERPRVHVRINDIRTDLGQADLDAVAALPALGGIRLPRVESADDVRLAVGIADRYRTDVGFHCLIETAAGVENSFRIATAPQVAAISLGEGDLRVELRLIDETAFDWVRSRIVVAAAAAQLPPPGMAVYGNVKDHAGLKVSCERGRRLGMHGRSAIHPAQLPVIAEVFAPTPAEIEHARRIVSAAQDRSGGFALPDGTFIDQPVVTAARRTLTRAANGR